ncbi:hypothetical protein EIP86_011497 [Pleurotus ostreatoroseus]|nr:hypothetical protein EIP86_011497 [Pleurotus ostreatoroseus]
MWPTWKLPNFRDKGLAAAVALAFVLSSLHLVLVLVLHPGPPSMSKFTPSPQEVALVNQIFTQADAQKIGVVTGEAAVKIFSGSKLAPTVLAEIWNLADDDHKGVLTRKDVAVAVRLLGHAQRGERVSEELIHKPGAVPSIEGLNAPISGQLSGVPSTKSPPPPASGLPPLTPQDKAKFMKLFTSCGPVSGILPGEKARDVFVKSKLPVDKLSQIWTLADTKNRGALDATDFTIAMYLIQASMSGQLQAIPRNLPPYLYDQAKPVSEGIVSHATGGSGSFSPTSLGGFPPRPVSVLQPQYTGQSALQAQMTGQKPNLSSPPRSASIPAFPPSPSQMQWDVTAAEKASSDQYFNNLDTQKRGYIEGDVAVPFMVQSKLSDDVLAQIWDLADLNNDGRLTRDGFAVAMHLIQHKLSGKDLPSTLPLTLIPPSMRNAAPAQPPRPPVPDAIKDLIWDETPPQSATAAQAPPVFPPPPTSSTISPQHTAQQPTANIFGAASDPFATYKQNFFEANVMTNHSIATSPPVHKDLLGDDDEPVAPSPPLQDKSAEIGNVQNQLHSTNRALETAKNERVDLERKLSEQATQLSALQTQLSSAKASYETENRLLATLRERFSTQNTDIQKTRTDLIRAESDLSAVRVEKAEVEGAVLRDKEEVRELQRKMTEVGSEVEMLKAEIEKAKKEAKQQKGLLAIAKKQLATREADRAKVAKELEDAQAEVQAATREREAAEAELAKVPEPNVISPERVASPASDNSLLFAAAQPLPASPDPVPASPAISTKSTNPFERLTLGSASPPSRTTSPFMPLAGAVAMAAPVPAAPPAAAPEPAPASTASAGDPFGFDDAFAGEEHVSSGDQTTTTEEPTSATTDASQAEGSPFGSAAVTPAAVADLASPAETDHFMTPPTSAAVPTSAVEEKPVEKAADSKSADVPAPSDTTAGTEEATDLDHQLKELEVEESDSDSEDDEPLNAVKAKLKSDSPAPDSQTGTSGSAFDDSFGIASTSTVTAPATASPPAQPAPAAASPFPPSSSTETTKAPVKATSEAPSTPEAPATVSDFDEALGKLSGSGTSNFSHVSQFTFDSAFEDDFDFAAAKAATASSSSPTAATHAAAAGTSSPFPPAPTQSAAPSGFDAVFIQQPSTSAAPAVPAPAAAPAPAPAPAPAAAPATFAPSHPFGSPSAFPPAPTTTAQPTQPAQSRPFSFDEAFGAVAAPNAAPSTFTPASNPAQAISFDDAFGSDSLALNNSFGSNAHSAAGSPPPAQKSSAPFPASASSPSSPIRASSFTSSMRSPSPPPRQTSPPPRLTSPRPRPSTASSDKEKSTRHSKLSVRSIH